MNEQSNEEWSSAHEIVFPCFGTFVRQDAFGRTIADPNHVLFFHREQPYRISHPLPGGDRSFVFALGPDALFELLGEFDPCVLERTAHPFRKGHTVAQTRERLLLWWLIQATQHQHLNDRWLIEEQAFTLLANVLASAVSLQRVNRRPTRTAQAHAELVHQAKLVLDERFKEKPSLAEIARAVGSSIYHLSRIFRQQTGLTLHRYLVRLRLFGILEYLAENVRAELTRTALDFGFDSLSHFSTAFRREFGFRPSQLRCPVTLPQLREMSKILKA